MSILEETEVEKDLDESADDEAEDTKPEPLEVPQDPNEPIEVVTAEAQKTARKERRAQRQNEFRQAQEERDRYRREVEELRSRVQQQQYQPAPQQQVHPAAARLQQIDAAEKQLHEHYRLRASQPGYDPNGPEQAEFERKAREIQTARIATVVSAQQPQFNEQEVIRKAQLQMYLNEHADISQDPTKMQWAYARWQQYRAEGKADTKEMSDAVFEEARRRFGLKTRSGGSPAADPATRQRLSGVPSRGTGAAPSSSGAVQMGPHEKRMARLAFGDRKDAKGNPWTEAQQYQHWANTVGKKLHEQKAKGG
jgi:hypothetical protein